ncbi:MAG: phage integrase N-terminal SAM-like domain-containing protein [Anaerolineaceae bacterium]|nr:phage integrase N-terminal SAM-like domain-containing protein [Anaerolineaceae bacterium]
MAQKIKLLDQVRQKIRLKGYSYQTEKTYVDWIKRFILFHQKRHPSEMGKDEVEAFLTHLAVDRDVAASTIRFGTALPRICWKRVLIFALFRNCWATKM